MTAARDPSVLLNPIAQVRAAEVAATPATLRDVVADIVEQHDADIAHSFYAYMLAQDNAKAFSSHEVVKQRLHREMQRGLRALFPPRGARPGPNNHCQWPA